MKSQSRGWFWLVPLLLLLTALSLPLSDADSLWYDEVWSLKNAGGALYGPLSPMGIWEQVALNDPHQAFGYPYLLALWGSAVGWSELAGRYLSLLAALLAIALTYRLGTEAHSRQVGLFSALVIATSAFFVYYTHELRAFTLVALASATTLLAYHRLLHRSLWQLSSAIIFVGGSLGLLYTHYFAAATLLGALGLYHLLLAPRNRRWWQLVGLALIVGLCFLPTLPAFLRGFTRFSPEDVRRIPLTAPEVVASLLNYVGNQALIAWAFLSIGVVALWQRRTTHLLLWVSVFGVGITLLANALLGILEPQRLRYVIVLWPLLAIGVGAGIVWFLQRTGRWQRWITAAIVVFWTVNAVWQHDGAWLDPLRAEDVLRWRTMTQVILPEASENDLFAYYGGTGREAYGVRLGFEYATAPLPFPSLVTSTLYEGDTPEWALGQVQNAQRVWYGVDRRAALNDYHESFEQELSKLFITCGRFVENSEMTLDLYVRDPAFCPTETALHSFDQRITLIGYSAPITEAGVLSTHLQWEIVPDIPAETYNLALHLVPMGETVPLAQFDGPLPNTPIALFDVSLDVADLPAGDYVLYVIIYNWRDGSRLPTAEGAGRVLLDQITLP